jgi:hypothetical protein
MDAALRLLRISLPVLALMACSSGGSGGGAQFTTFKGLSAGDTQTLRTVVMLVQTTSFSPPAPLFPTASLQSGTVTAQVTLKDYNANNIDVLHGTWDENNNTLDVSAGGITMDGGYNVGANQIGGEVHYPNGDDDQWTGLLGKNATIYCGTWTAILNQTAFGIVIIGSDARGYADQFGTAVSGTVNGNSVSFSAGGFPGTATFGASGISGTVNGQSFTGAVCG